MHQAGNIVHELRLAVPSWAGGGAAAPKAVLSGRTETSSRALAWKLYERAEGRRSQEICLVNVLTGS